MTATVLPGAARCPPASANPGPSRKGGGGRHTGPPAVSFDSRWLASGSGEAGPRAPAPRQPLGAAAARAICTGRARPWVQGTAGAGTDARPGPDLEEKGRRGEGRTGGGGEERGGGGGGT